MKAAPTCFGSNKAIIKGSHPVLS